MKWYMRRDDLREMSGWKEDGYGWSEWGRVYR